MANSCPSLDINPNRPSVQVQPGTCQHCFSTPAHMSNQLSDHMCPGLSPCPMLTARLIANTTSSIHSLGQDLLGHKPTPSHALLQTTIIHTRPMLSSTHPSNLVYQFEPTCFSTSRWLGFDSLHAYVIAPPSTEWNLSPDSSSTFNMTPW
jgi:hypothetical protein